MPADSVRALTVSELNEYARRILAGDPLLRNVEVSGEISGYKHHYSGHRYFTLKDTQARVQCVMFRQSAMGLDFTPVDGMKVVVRGSASVFVRDGSYQLYVTQMRRSGLGDLYEQFEKLKAKLLAEGLFDPARKREIPFLPRKIGIVTSETGAAVHDMIRVARRRNPNIEILVAPCAVQGASAAPEIVRAIRRLNENGECDVLLVGRGGGSIEDLWAFNEESVARAIAASRIPVISCVGHEVDFTIADYAADLRAATPSAAAELAVPVLAELQASLDSLGLRLRQALGRGQDARRAALRRLTSSMVLSMPQKTLLAPRVLRLEQADRALNRAMALRMDREHRRLERAAALLRTLNPESVLDRGYALAVQNGKIVTSAAKLKPGEDFSVRLSDGRIDANVQKVETEKRHGEEENQL